MPQNLRAIRRKTHTVQSIWKITRAMKMVAAAKLRRVQGAVENGRVYWDRLDEILRDVAGRVGEISHPFLEPRDVEPVGVVVIAGSRGLCGSFNVTLLREAAGFLSGLDRPVKLITVGPKAAQSFAKGPWDVVQSYPSPDDAGRATMARQLSRQLQTMLLTNQVGEVHVLYSRFYSAMRHVPTARQLLPIAPPEAAKNGDAARSILFEPPAEQLLASLLPRATDAAVYEMLLNAAASEEGARMTAMTTATDNAEEMIVTLTRDFNRARQTQITNELLEVIAGADALAE